MGRERLAASAISGPAGAKVGRDAGLTKEEPGLIVELCYIDLEASETSVA